MSSQGQDTKREKANIPLDLDKSRKQDNDKWHTMKWYKEHYGVDPLKLGLNPKLVSNPHFRSSAKMRLWSESEVMPFRSEEGIEAFKKRREAGLKGARTRRDKLKKWFTSLREDKPEVQEIVKRLWEIGERIQVLHFEKAACRDADPWDDSGAYFDLGVEHCKKCLKMTREQTKLRNARASLFSELERLCETDKKTIQLARRYLRDENL